MILLFRCRAQNVLGRGPCRHSDDSGTIMTIARRIVVALALAAGLAAAPARATIITAGSYDFNLDFTAAMPYDWANVQFVVASLAAGQHVSVTFFPDLNEGGVPIGPGTLPGPFSVPITVVAGTSDPGLLDGIFSVRFTLDVGTADIGSPFAFVSHLFAGPPIASVPLLFQATVPEPGTFALLAVGLAALAFARRRVWQVRVR